MFRQVVSLFSSLFPESRPQDVKPVDPVSWFRGFGDSEQCDPKVFLACFDHIRSIMSEVEDCLFTSAHGRKKAVNILPSWGDIYKLCNYPDLHKAPPINEQFSRLLDKPLALSRHIAMLIYECLRLETCIHGLVESQSFSSWAMASVFALLRDANLAPGKEGFHKLVSSLSVALNSQAKASFAAAEYLKQKCRETYVSHLLSHTHDSVRHALLSSKSSSSLFAEEVIEKSFGQMKDDSQLLLLKNLSSQKEGKELASSSSSSAQRRPRLESSQSLSSSRSSRSSLRGSRGSKHPSSHSPSRLRSPKPSSKSPAKKKTIFSQ